MDIGSHSVLLTVAGRGPGGRLAPVHDSVRVCRLGEGLTRSGGMLTQVAATRTLLAMKELVIEARAHGAGSLVAAGTAVLRSARNAAPFLEEARKILGTDIRVLAGEDEARLAWLGVTGGRYPSKPTSVMDVGGGSTEYIRATTRGPLRPISVPVGAVTLFEATEGGDAGAVGAMAAQALVGCGLEPRPTDRLVVVGGTATTLAAIHRGLRVYDSRKIEGTRMGMADILGLLNRMACMERNERVRVPGMDPERVDTIVPGAVILAVAMKCLDAREATISTKGLRHGLLIETFGMSGKDGAPE
jgi:exopolyphosphatase/guanosine-5'-triphosphate,3'-diphosphate pyrophosphatase